MVALSFAVVGASGAVVNLLALHVFYSVLRWPLVGSVVLASELAVICNFLFNNRWTFRQRHVSLRRLVRFNVSSVVGVALAAAITIALVHVGWSYLPADVTGIVAGAGCNFVASAGWTWKHGVEYSSRPDGGSHVMPTLPRSLTKIGGFALGVVALIVLFLLLYSCPVAVFLVIPAVWGAGKLVGSRSARPRQPA